MTGQKPWEGSEKRGSCRTHGRHPKDKGTGVQRTTADFHACCIPQVSQARRHARTHSAHERGDFRLC